MVKIPDLTRATLSKEEKRLLKEEERIERKIARHRAFASTLQTTSKQLIWLFSVFGVIWITCSYILAFMNKGQIAEALSSNVCTVVIGQMAMYLLTKTVENCSKYNDKLFGKSNDAALVREGVVGSTCEPVTPTESCTDVPPEPDINPDDVQNDMTDQPC